MILDVIYSLFSGFREALSMLSFSQSRQVKPTAWKCQLEVTNDLKIPICGYSKVSNQYLLSSYTSI